jgi:uncharacterized membrane protein YdjX (TVP38/TMEM64 family)
MQNKAFRIHRLSPTKLARWQLAGALIVFVTMGLLAFHVSPQQWHSLLNKLLHNQGWSASLILLGVYVLAVVFLLPLLPFAIAAGLFLGFWQGAIIALIAINTGALVSFLITRHWLKRWFLISFQSWQPKNRTARSSLAILTSEDIRVISLLRLNPLVPFSLHNYVYGAAKTNLRPYMWGTFLGSAPFTLLLVYFGVTGRVLYKTGSLGPWQYSMVGLGILLSFVLLVLTRYARSVSQFNG